MKKILGILILLFIIIFFSVYALILSNKAEKNNLRNYNQEYEHYLNKEIYGTELATLINKAVNTNENNRIEKDEKNYYIDNYENSIKIEIKITYTDKTYAMEEIYNKNTAEFVKNFNLEKFKCTKIEYHKQTGKISKMLFEQT